MWPFTKPSTGSQPINDTLITYREDQPLHTYQNRWTWPWPNVPAHETRAALANCWTGNQLPGMTNYIPGVGKSKFMWNVPTSYANTLKNQQFNRGFNIQSQSAFQSALLNTMAQQAWQNRMTG